MARRPRRNHGAEFKARAALAAIRGDKTLAEIADVGRLHNEVGWTPNYDLDSGLGDTITYWRQSLAAASPDR